MTITDFFNELVDVQKRLEKAQTFKSKNKDLDVLLSLVECQITCFIVYITIDKQKIDDFGGFRLINHLLNEWEELEKQQAADSLKNKQ